MWTVSRLNKKIGGTDVYDPREGAPAHQEWSRLPIGQALLTPVGKLMGVKLHGFVERRDPWGNHHGRRGNQVAMFRAQRWRGHRLGTDHHGGRTRDHGCQYFWSTTYWPDHRVRYIPFLTGRIRLVAEGNGWADIYRSIF